MELLRKFWIELKKGMKIGTVTNGTQKKRELGGGKNKINTPLN